MKTPLYRSLTKERKALVDALVYDACVERYRAFSNAPQSFVDAERESFARKIPFLEQMADAHKEQPKPRPDSHTARLNEPEAGNDSTTIKGFW